MLVPISITSVAAAFAQRLGREQRRDVVAADEAADIRCNMEIGAGRGRNAQVARLHVDRLAERSDEGRAAELAHRQAEQQVMHRRVAAHSEIDDVRWPRSRRLAQVMREAGDGGDGGGAAARRAAAGERMAWLTRLTRSAP